MAKQATATTAKTRTAGKTRKRAVSAPATLPADAPQSATRQPSHHEIALHAYGLYLARGAHEGSELNDWLRAEHELCTQRA